MGLGLRIVALASVPLLAHAQGVVPDAGDVAEAAEASGAAETPEPAASAPTGTRLAEFVALAEGRYPGLDAANAGIAAAEARLREARISPFMQFQVDLGAAMVPDAQGTPIYTPSGQLGDLRSWGPAGSVSVSGAIPIYTFGKLREAWNAGEAGIAAAESNLERAGAQVRLDVRRAYFTLSFALDVLQMIREGEGKLERALETFDERVEEGDADLEPMDRYRLAAALAEIRARRSQAELARASAEAALSALSGLPEIVISDCPLEPVRGDFPSVAELAGTASERPELAMLAAAREARSAELGVHRARYYPDLVLGLSASYSVAPGITDIANPYISDRGNVRGLGFALAARWSLDFGGNRMRVLRARAQLAEVEAQREEAQLGADLELRIARERLADAERRVRAWSDGERETRQWFVSAVQGYQVGAVEPKALVDALKAYFSARASRLEAVLDHNVTAAVLERVSGRPLLPDSAWEPSCE